MTTDLIDRDVFALSRDDDTACAVIFSIRDGKMIGKRHFILVILSLRPMRISFKPWSKKWYLETDFIPDEIVVSHEPEQLDFLDRWLRNKRGSTIEITVPKIGDKKNSSPWQLPIPTFNSGITSATGSPREMHCRG